MYFFILFRASKLATRVAREIQPIRFHINFFMLEMLVITYKSLNAKAYRETCCCFPKQIDPHVGERKHISTTT
jgi:hypothetical protein